MGEAQERSAREESSRKVFLSHSSADKRQVEALRDALEQRGIACYLDALELRAGDTLTAELKEVVQEARAFLVVLSPVDSSWILGAADIQEWLSRGTAVSATLDCEDSRVHT